ncbi:MAG: hypothetical protein VYA61_06170, partial [Pseudomonadota bacterium]|nr:hypothetical protein [Pseudomonadota bacterium]
IIFAFRYFFLYHWNRTDSRWWPNGFALILWLAILTSKPNLAPVLQSHAYLMYWALISHHT